MFLEFVCEVCGYENHQDIDEEYISTEETTLIEAKCSYCNNVVEYELKVELKQILGDEESLKRRSK